jgi:hypothetical protein
MVGGLLLSLALLAAPAGLLAAPRAALPAASPRTASPPPTSFEATRAPGGVQLSWVSPPGASSVRILRSMIAFAASSTPAADQAIVFEGPGTEALDIAATVGGDYHYTAFAADPGGDWSTPATAGIVIPPLYRTTLAMLSPTRVLDYRGVVRLTGYLRAWGGDGRPRFVGFRPDIGLSASTDGGRTWIAAGSAAYDWRRQGYVVDRRPPETTRFLLVFPGEGDYGPSVSNTLVVGVRSAVSAPACPARVRRAAPFRVSGTVRPPHLGFTLLQFHRLERGRWVSRAKVKVRDITAGSYSSYSIRTRLRSTGDWRVRAYQRDPHHAPTVGPARRFRVT